MDSTEQELRMVGIGASAGGLEAINSLFDNVPNDTGMAFVIIQHLSPTFKSLMPELLAKHTMMPVFVAEEGQVLEPNTIYLNQGMKNLQVKNGKLCLIEKAPPGHLNLPIDIFFTSMGRELEERAIAIVLSGTGSDGSKGIKVVSEMGGTVIAQDPASAQFDGMPNAAIGTNLADVIVVPEDMGKVIEKLAAASSLTAVDDDNDPSQAERKFLAILKTVQHSSGIDFSDYKRATILRRLEKRVTINSMGGLTDYLSLIETSSKEREALMQDFLIGVTHFFRDPQAFQMLKAKVLPGLLSGKPRGQVIRIWVAGCSTGEEVYSLAMLLDEFIELHNLEISYKIFATDVDTEALSIASAGIYRSNTAELEPQYKEKYFIRAAGAQIQIAKRIRDRIVFSRHNLITDPPFVKLDLVSCRNLLIYFENHCQKKVLAKFHFALNQEGYLFLGSSESLGEIGPHFRTHDSRWKLYRKIPGGRNPLGAGEMSNSPGVIVPGYNKLMGRQRAYTLKKTPEYNILKLLSSKYAPSGVVTDKSFNILYIIGDVSELLSVGEGVFQGNILEMISSELSSVIRSSIRQLNNAKSDVRVRDVVISTQGRKHTYDMTFTRFANDGDVEDVYFIGFTENSDRPESELLVETCSFDDISRGRIEDLETELKINRQELQNAIEELETSNEELQSSNEELMASNEELQGTNEELQSVNEELYTVNAEMQERNRQLSDLNNDISNLFNSTDIGTVFLDLDLNIRKFTPALKTHFKLKEDDIGRSIHTFSSEFSPGTNRLMIEESERVLRELVTVEHEVVGLDQTHHLMRISPFITADKKIDGVVVSFIDIDILRQSQDELIFLNSINQFIDEDETFSQFLEKISKDVVRLLRIDSCTIYLLDNKAQKLTLTANSLEHEDILEAEPLSHLFQPGHVISLDQKSDFSKAIKTMASVTSTDPASAMESLTASASERDKIPDVVQAIAYTGQIRLPIIDQGEVLGVIEVPLSKALSKNERISMERVVSQIASAVAKFRNDEKIREFREGFRAIVEATPNPVFITGANDSRLVFANSTYFSFFGLTPSSLESQPRVSWIADPQIVEDISNELAQNQAVYGREILGRKPDGTEFWGLYSARSMNYRGEACIFQSFQDITERREHREQLESIVDQRTTELNEALSDSEFARSRLDSVIKSITEGLLVISHSGTIELLNSYAESLLGISAEASRGKHYSKASLPANVQKAITDGIKAPNGTHITGFQLPTHDKGVNKEIIASTTEVRSAHSNSLEGHLTIFRDVTHERNIDRLKTQFIATAAHQLRTPLTTIQGFSEILDTRTDIDESKRGDLVHSISEQSQKLSEIVDELLDISKIEGGEAIALVVEPTMVDDFVDTLMTLHCSPIVTKHEFVRTMNVSDMKYDLDRSKLEHCLRNILSNAAKYSQPGTRIELNVEIRDANLVFSVIDQGIGMTQEQLKLAGDRFWRADTSDTAVEGTGLGLSIVRSFVQIMNGTLRLESTPGKGTTVAIAVPAIPSLVDG